MKKTMKKYLISSLVLGTACFGLLGFSTLGAANADETDPFANFKVQETAEIRTTAPVGIRFTTVVDAAIKAEVGEDATFGTMVIPKALLTDGADEGTEVTIDDLTIGAAKAANVVSTKWFTEDQTSYTAVIVGQQDGEGNYTALPESFYDDVFYARGYVTYNGKTVYTSNYCEKSIAYVASAALAAGENEDIYQTIVNAVITEDLAWNATNSEIQLNVLGESAEVALATDTKGLVVKYESSDENIAKYENGKVIPVGAGTATITASIGSKQANLSVKVGARQFANGVLNDFLSVQDSGGGNWHPDNTPVLVNLADKGLAAPKAADGYTGPLTKTTAIEWNINSQGQVSNWINLYNFFENIDSYGAMDYVGIWLYLDLSAYTSSTSIYATPANSWGQNATTYSSIYTTYEIPTMGQWTMLSVTVAEIKAAMASNTAINYGALALALRPTAESSHGASVYLYSVEIYDGNGSTINDMATKSTDYGHLGWWGDRWASEATPAAVGNPTGAEAKTTLPYYTNQDANGQLGPMFDITTIMNSLDYCNPMDYISIWMYANASSIAASSNNSYKVSYYLATKFAVSPGDATATQQILSGKYVAFNEWTEIKISVGELMTLSDPNNVTTAWDGTTALTKIGFVLTPRTNLGTTQGAFKAYFHSIEYHEADTAAYANTTVLTKNAWGTGGTFAMIDTPTAIGVPEGKTDNGKLVQFVSDGSGQAMFELTAEYANVRTLSLMLGDNDKLRIWVYADTTAAMTAHTLWAGVPFDWNKKCSGVNTADTITTGEWSAWDITGAEIRQLIAIWDAYAETNSCSKVNETLMLKLQASGTFNYYFHSVEIVKA